MLQLTTMVRLGLLVICSLFLVSCNQSTNDKSAIDAVLTADIRSEKIKAARKRAAQARIDRKKAFEKRRQEQRTTRTAALSKKNEVVIAKPQNTKSTRRSSQKTAKLKRSKVKSLKKTQYAFIGGRSRGISKKAPWRCVPKRLKIVLNQVSKKFGKVIINSTHRSYSHNRRVGGKRRSYHLKCQAVDFRVQGRNRGLRRWLARHPYVGGYKRYRSGFYHIDTGPKRTW